MRSLSNLTKISLLYFTWKVSVALNQVDFSFVLFRGPLVWLSLAKALDGASVNSSVARLVVSLFH